MPLLPLLLVLAATPTLTPALPRAGAFGAGFHVEPLSLGSVQALGAGGHAAGIHLLGALQLDLGTRWAFRLPLALEGGGPSAENFAALGVTPGLLYRWRSSADQRWVPYAGAGLRLGVAVAGRGLLGLPLVQQQAAGRVSALGLDDHHWGGGGDDPNDEGRLGAFPELWLGLDFQPTRWFALTLGGSYTYVRLLGTNVHVLSERIGTKFSF